MRVACSTILTVAITLLLLVGIVPMLVPVPSLEHTVPPRELADPDSRFASLMDLEVHYKLDGQGDPPLVLLHGFGASLYSWRQVHAPLASQYAVLAFDRPAFGLTSRPLPNNWADANPYSPEAASDLTVALMDSLDLERAVLVGHSAGGASALLTALRYPDRVVALILVSPAVYDGGSPHWVRPLLHLPQARRLGPLLVRVLLQRYGTDGIERSWHDPTRIPPETLDLYRLPLRAANWDQALWEYTLANRPLNTKQLRDVMVPTLVLTGDDDRLVAPAAAERLAADLPHARLVVIPACGHLAHEECPDAFLLEAMDFIDGLR